MRGWYILMAALLLSTGVMADLCSDTDGGGGESRHKDSLTTKGDVKYGITTQSDTCLTSQSGVSTPSSNYLKEYYCQTDKRESEVYDCTRYGFSGCDNGACVDPAGSNQTGNQSQSTTQYVNTADHCGNRILEKDLGEKCDPPGKICFGSNTAQYGVCLDDCTCKIAKAALNASVDPNYVYNDTTTNTTSSVCGDGTVEGSESCEEDSDCAASHVCSSCNCVKQLTPEEIAAMTKAAKEGKTVDTSTVDTTIDLEPKNFSEDPAVKAATEAGGFFSGIWGWIVGLFS